MIKKLIFWVLILFILTSGGLIAYVYFNQDMLKNQLILAVNERLIVPVDVKEVNISPLSSFPDATVAFTDVKIMDPYVNDSIFVRAGEVSFSFNIWSLLQGDMVLEEIHIRDGHVNIIQYAADKWSYEIYKEAERSSGNFTMDIQNIDLQNISAIYQSDLTSTQWSGVIRNTDASVRVQGPVTLIQLDSDISSTLLSIKDFETLQGQSVEAEAELLLDRHWKISTSLLRIGDSDFGLLVTKDEEDIKVDFEAKDANVKTLLSLAPAQIKERLKNYSSKGKITLSADINHNFASGITSLGSGLVFKGVNISQKDPQIDMQDLHLTGTINIPDFNSYEKSTMSFNDIRGRMNGKAMAGNFLMHDFKEPFIKASYKGEMPLAFLKDMAGLPIWEPSGNLVINLTIEGSLAAITDEEGIKKSRTSGEVTFHDIKFYLPNRAYAIEAPEGTVIFNNDHLAINNFDLLMGRSHFKINGQLRNFWNISSSKNWSATADVHSESLMLDELLSVENADPKAEKYSFQLPSNITLELNATVDDFKARRFTAKRISGKILVKDKVLQADKLSLESMGGLIKLKGQWQDLQQKGSNIDISFLLAGIHADSLFYSFENFNQDFITDKNLSGNIYAEAEASLRLDSNLGFLPKMLNANLNTRIVNGELRDFKPLYSLEEYLDKADLSKVKFAELENQIYIQNETIHLPLMAVGTNIIKFKIGGTHTFDQHIDYDVVAPLNRKKRVDKDERFGAIAEDQHGETLLFLSIIGTTSDFAISIDKQALKKEMASDVKREIKEMQDAFKNNGKTTATEVVLEEDDYFDWDQEN